MGILDKTRIANRQRGALLLAVWPRWAAWQVGALIAIAATAVFVVWRWTFEGSSHSWGLLVFWLCYFLAFALPSLLRFYEKGVWYFLSPVSMPTFCGPKISPNSWYFAFERALSGEAYQLFPPLRKTC